MHIKTVPSVPILHRILSFVPSALIIMSIFTDGVVGLFYDYVRLGNSLKNPGSVLHCRLGDSPGERSGPFGAVGSVEEIALVNGNEDSIRICTMSDTHDRHYLFTELPICDILIHTGDIFMTGRLISDSLAVDKLNKFNDWLGTLPATHKIVIGGNHDKIFEQLGAEAVQSILTNAHYLCNSSVQLYGLTFWGTPLSHGRSGNAAFQHPSFEEAALDILKERMTSSQEEVDVLITHGPCSHIGELVQPRLMHMSGHVHRDHGIRVTRRKNHDDGTARRQWYRVSAPIMDHKYHPTQLPIVVDIARPNK